MKKKIGLLLVVCLLFGLTFTGCSSQDSNTIKIGYLVHVTGDSALWGICEKNGALLAVNEINNAGGVLGKKIDLQFYDGRGNSADSVNAVKKAVEQDKVKVMLGSNLSGPTIAVAPICAQNKVPQIASFATNKRVTLDDNGKVLPWSFRLCFTDPYQGEIIANYSIKKMNKKNAAILFDVTSDYSSGLTEYFEKSFNELGGNIVAKVAFRGGDIDFRPQLSDIKGKNPDILILPNLYKENALIAKQAKDLGIDITMMAGDSYSPTMFEIFPEMNNYYTVQHFSWQDSDLKSIRNIYEKEFKEKNPELNAPMGYDMVYFIADCIKRAGKADGEAIRQAIENAKDVKLTHAAITISPENHNPVNKAGVILKLEDKQDKFVEKYSPNN